MATDAHINCLVVMAKSPQAGKVKTRLIPVLGRVGAMRLYQELLTDSLSRLSQSDCYERYLSCTPDIRHPVFLHHRHSQQWHLQQQPVGDLGMRMTHIFSRLLRHYAAVIVVGSDLVNLGGNEIKNAFSALEGNADLVIGTTHDGGYGMIGMKRLHAGLFRGMPWSTARVANITLARARRMKLKIWVMHGLQDIDTPSDYHQWLTSKATGNTGFRNVIA